MLTAEQGAVAIDALDIADHRPAACQIAEPARRQAGLVVLHWTPVFAVAIGCVIVLSVKGWAFVADAYPPPGRE